MTKSDAITATLVQLKESIQALEKDISRARIKDLYELGHLQGQLIGLEKAQNILLGKVDELNP